jgi:hypothetical protein
MVCRVRESMRESMCGPGLYTGTTTDTFIPQ